MKLKLFMSVACVSIRKKVAGLRALLRAVRLNRQQPATGAAAHRLGLSSWHRSVREPLLVVAHQAILRVLYAYFTGMRREDCIQVSIPLNTIIKITPTSRGFDEERFHPIGDCTLDPHLLDPASH